jgi:hypothetical protein
MLVIGRLDEKVVSLLSQVNRAGLVQAASAPFRLVGRTLLRIGRLVTGRS